MKIYCQNELCVYQEENFCLLNQISLDPLGHCEECILITLPAEQLKKLKEKQLK